MESDAGVSINKNPKFSMHAQGTVAKCDRILGFFHCLVASSNLCIQHSGSMNGFYEYLLEEP